MDNKDNTTAMTATAWDNMDNMAAATVTSLASVATPPSEASVATPALATSVATLALETTPCFSDFVGDSRFGDFGDFVGDSPFTDFGGSRFSDFGDFRFGDCGVITISEISTFCFDSRRFFIITPPATAMTMTMLMLIHLGLAQHGVLLLKDTETGTFHAEGGGKY